MIFGTGKPALFSTTTKTISTTTYSGGYITVNTTTNHGYSAGMGVLIQGVTTMTDANGIWEIYDAPTVSSFRFRKTTAQGSGSSGDTRGGELLDHSFIEYEPIIPDQLNHRSVITGVKTNTHLGDYGEFKVVVRLWQYSSAKNKFTALYSYYHTDINFAPHRSQIVQDSTTAFVTCYLKTFRPIYYKNFINYDAVELTFSTNKYHDITKLLI